MRATTSSWALGGALLASIATNVLLWLDTGQASQQDRGSQIVNTWVSDYDLSPAQVERVIADCQDCCQLDQDLQQKIDTAIARLADVMGQEEVDATSARELIAELGALRTRSMFNTFDSALILRQVLTPDQRRGLADCCGQAR